jgi:hypothetical protein
MDRSIVRQDELLSIVRTQVRLCIQTRLDGRCVCLPRLSAQKNYQSNYPFFPEIPPVRLVQIVHINF